jgi:hypothetical protein
MLALSTNGGEFNVASIRAEPRRSRARPNFNVPASAGYPQVFDGDESMGWHIGRTEALTDPAAARRKALDHLRGLAELDDPEALVVPILLDALLMVESYRGARHQISFLPELTSNVDALLRELTIIEKTKEWANG